MEAFIANRLEVSLRLAWLNTTSGKNRGMRLKEKLNAAASAAANAYWRTKACADWWENLDAATRKKIWTFLLGKSAKSVIYEILREANQAPQGEMWLFNFGGGTAREGHSETSALSFCDMVLEQTSVSRSPNALASNLSGLFQPQEFASLLILCQNGLVPVQSVFFSSFSSLTTLVDCILRKIRGLLMVISVDSVKLELLDGNTHKCSPSSSSKQKLGSTSRKHKGKTGNMKKPIPEAKSDKNVNLSAKSIKY